MIPGEYIVKETPIACNVGRPTLQLTAVNTGDRPIQIGSHFHFFEVNKQMAFDREKAYGMRLNIAAGTAVRFEPGEEKNIELIPFGGNQIIAGFNSLVDGKLADQKNSAIEKATTQHYKNQLP